MNKRFIMQKNPFFTDGGNGKIYDFQIRGNSINDGLPYPDGAASIINSGTNINVYLRGKNLISTEYFSTPRTSLGVTAQYLSDEDCFVLNGTSTAQGSIVDPTLLVGGVKGKKLFWSITYLSGQTTGGRAIVASKNDLATTSVDFVGVGFSENNQTVSKYCTDSYISRFWLWFPAGATFTNYKFRLQLEINDNGNTAYVKYHNYNPNSAQTYTVPIKDTSNNSLTLRQRDQILKYNNEWLFLQNTATITFNGTETWEMVSTSAGNTFKTNIANKRPGLTNILCNYWEIGENSCYGSATTGDIYILYATLTSVDEFKAYLQACSPAFEIEYELSSTVTKTLSTDTANGLETIAIMRRGNYNYLTGIDTVVTNAGIPYPLITGTYATYDDTEYFEDIHLSDKSTVSQYGTKVNSGDVENAHTLVAGQDFENKQLNAKTLNYLFEQIDIIQNSKDNTFKQNKIEVADTAPSGLKNGQIYFKT